MKAVLKIKSGDTVTEETVNLKGIRYEDGVQKVQEAARKLLAPRNEGRPAWDPAVVLLGVRLILDESV